MSDGPVVWFEIYVQDMPRARAFYEQVLAISLEKLDTPGLEMWRFPEHSAGVGASGSLVRMPEVQSGGNSVLVYFGCADCAVEEARVTAAGGRIQRPKMSIGEHGFITLAVDTEGNMFGLHSSK